METSNDSGQKKKGALQQVTAVKLKKDQVLVIIHESQNDMGNKRTEDVILFQSKAAHFSHLELILPHDYNYTQYKCWWSMKSNWTSTHIHLKLSMCTRTQLTHSGYMDDINEDRQQTLVNEVNKGSDILDHWGEGRQPWKQPDKWSHAPCDHFYFAITFSDQCSTMNRGQL